MHRCPTSKNEDAPCNPLCQDARHVDLVYVGAGWADMLPEVWCARWRAKCLDRYGTCVCHIQAYRPAEAPPGPYPCDQEIAPYATVPMRITYTVEEHSHHA